MSEEFKTLFEESAKGFSLKEGDVLKGRIISLLRDQVMVDVGFKSEGLISKEEFRNFDGDVEANLGDEVDVMIENLEDKNGRIVLSKERADALRSWDHVEAVADGGGTIDGLIVNKIKGGMSVNLGGIKAFLPASQIDLKPVKSLDKLINKKFKFKILKLNKVKGNIVLSRRAVLEVERETLKKELLENIQEGQVVNGTVKNITDYGVFVDLGGVDGLLHITDMTWGRVNHPSEIFKLGQEIEVLITKYDAEKEKVSLGYKQLKDDPWNEVNSKFIPGQQIKGKVVSMTDYGAFLEIEDGIEGLVHLTELSWKKIKHPSKVVKEGQELDAVILDIDKANRRLSLGVKQLEENPWKEIEEKYPAGTKVKGKVRNITDFGVFLGLDGEEVDGLIHISDLSWDKEIGHPSELVKKGDELEVIVLSVDKDNERFSLGLKQLVDNPWESIRQKYKAGAKIDTEVSELSDKGLYVKLEDEGITGFISNGDLSSLEKIKAKDKFKVGDKITAQVKKFDEKAKQVILSIRALEKSEEKANMKDFLSKQGNASATLADALKEK